MAAGHLDSRLGGGRVTEQLLGAITDAADPMVMMRRVLDAAVALIPVAEGAALELISDNQLNYVCVTGMLASQVGLVVPLHGSLSGLALRTAETLFCGDTRVDARVDAAACARAGVGSMVCVPLRRGDQQLGVMKVTASSAGAFDAQDAAILEPVSGFIATVIAAAEDICRAAAAVVEPDSCTSSSRCEPREAPSHPAAPAREFVANVLRPGMVRQFQARERIDHVLREQAIQIVCQPIVDLNTGALYGFEALSRFSGAPSRPPDRWFAEAAHVGRGVELELLAVARALELCDRLPAAAILTINVSASALADPRLGQLLADAPGERIMLELTEHVRIDDYPQLRDQLTRFRQSGVRLAIDDAGAGFASLGHIVNLAPDLIKLDRQFAHGLDRDPARRAAAHAILSLARDTGAEVVAEGIETPREHHAARELNIPYGQGYLFSAPMPLEALPAQFAQPGRGRQQTRRNQARQQRPAATGHTLSQPG